MKKISFLFLLVFTTLITQAAEPYNYNQNYNFNKYIKEGKWISYADDYDKYEVNLTKENTGKTDFEGNEIFKWHFKCDKYEAYLVPDNEFYPLFYRLLVKRDDKKGFYSQDTDRSGMRDIGFIVLNENHIACVVINDEAAALKEEKVNHSRIAVTVSNYNNLYHRMEPKTTASLYSFYRGKATGSPYRDWAAFMLAENLQEFYSTDSHKGKPMTQWKGIPTYYENLLKYQERQLELAKTKKLDALLSEFADGEYKLYTESSSYGKMDYGKIKLTFEKTNGKVTGFTVQNCFTDGLFYDKEKFFVKHTVGANGEVNFDGGKFYIIPFDGRLLIYYTMDGGMSSIMAVISPNQQDQFAEYISKGDFWSVNETDHTYFCKTEMETEYNKKLDKWKFGTFIQKYQKAFLAK
ncbi:hypothetical protein [Fluviicola taffensis]|uniref:YARHG domain-containing protein n=1 Tax=Fluviicola taffensis (strain DSM 16823 / NCIMB 13979 / RW262) TaxID=755732 RepID=F2IHH9_FLUTR|nr:hypothetical protein [Fluviicola taffensis]AEA43744.1 hypothetical protein Fluta_1753 [Fluviicola taffensis DSM 16823]